jgi:hypothetical protein
MMILVIVGSTANLHSVKREEGIRIQSVIGFIDWF